MSERLEAGQNKTCVCGAHIVGAAHHKTGKVSPIVLDPSERGNILLWRGESVRDTHVGQLTYGIVPTGVPLDALRNMGVPLRLNHFADCPESDRFRYKEESRAASTAD